VNADNNGNVYIGGRTDFYSEDSFPTKNAFQPQNGGFGDGWAAKISSTPASPLVNSLRGRGGPVDGGTSVVLTGVGFTGATSVRFGSTPAASFKVDSPTQITAVSPAHAAGKVNVTVTTPAGTTPDNPVTLFEYAEGVWRPTGSLNRVHYDHQVRTLSNGKVLLIGGQSSIFGTTITSTEIYDPKAGTWSDADDLNTARSAYTVTRLDGPACRTASPAAYCGDLLVVGGSPNSASTNASLNTAEIYDAASNTWTDVTGNMVVPRSQHTAVLLDGPECRAGSPPAYCGKVLLAAGFSGSNGTPASASLSSAELFDPATGQFTATGPLQHTARQTTSVLLPSGKVLLPGGNGTNRAASEIYNPASGTWGSTLPMNVGRERHTVTVLPDGKVLAASGITPGDPPHLGTPKQAGDSAEIFDEGTSTWTLLPDRLAAGAARNNHDTAVLPSGKVLLAGGGRGGLTSELFDPSAGRWKSAGLMTISHGSAHPQAASYDTVVISSRQDRFEADSDVCGNNCGKVLVAGNTDTATAELYTPEPKVSGFSPTFGRRGTSVKITGQGFTHGVRAVLFGGRPAASFRVDSYGQITAVAPTGGSGKITVLNEGGRAISAGTFALLAEPPIYPPPGSGCAAGTSAGVVCQSNGQGGLTITGTAGANRIVGTTGPDVIRCGAGDDVVFAGAGDDVIRCGAGNDTIDAGAGNDQAFGEAGRDKVAGAAGRDRASGGAGNDNVGGGAGNDRASGDSGNDRVSGNSGNDRVSGNSGNDRVSGNSGNDRLAGNGGNDRLSGGSGRDSMSSGSGRDRLSGGSGNDRLNTRDRRGRDTANCGGGRRDRASVDRTDRVRGCERVSRRRR
jgi:Ca2+-binding RTX toxin-like protein